ncbi:hypothetical protein BJX66DRAFT_299478 [Aspergillus keveii]|uniref:Uncharacterized protein n=1 Tax=Aspergillus keveii TaxID=714993 RepID=A0ABR4GC41_9EURO
MAIYIPIPDGFPPPPPIVTDTTPLILDEATRALYTRAISDPSSLTDHERRLITRRPPKEEEDTLCRGACGLSMDTLIAKAINSTVHDPSDTNEIINNYDSVNLPELPLSKIEAGILTVGVAGAVQKRTLESINEWARLSPEDRDLKQRAMQAATTDDVRAARKVAAGVQKRWSDVRHAAREALNDDDTRNIRAAMKVPWQDHVLKGGGDRFGLVVFYSEDEEREERAGEGKGESRLALYKSQIGTAIYHALHYPISLVRDETRARFALHWVAVLTNTSGYENRGSDDVVDLSALRSQFRTMLSSEEIPDGFRRDAFLYVDEETFRSRETARPYVWLAEPEPESQHESETQQASGTESEPRPEHETENETGTGTGNPPPSKVLPPLKVDIKHIAPALFARLVQRDFQGEARRKPYRYTSELSQLHHAATVAYRKWGRREGDGIWPPPYRMQ